MENLKCSDKKELRKLKLATHPDKNADCQADAKDKFSIVNAKCIDKDASVAKKLIMELTVKQLKAELDSMGAPYPSKAKKAELEKLLRNAKKKKNKKPKPGKKPDYQRFPKQIKLMDGTMIENPDAGCGPDMFLMKDGTCKRKFDADVLDMLCPKIYVNKGILNPKKMQVIMDEMGLKGMPLTEQEIDLLQNNCDRMREQALDEAQSMDARDILIFEILKEQFAKMPALFGKKLFDEFFGAIGYRTSKIAAGYVEIKKKVADSRVGRAVRQIPFAAIAGGLLGGAKKTGKLLWKGSKFLAKKGFRAAQWVYNNSAAQRFLMHLAKLVKHGICTAMGQVKDRKDMSWKDWGNEKWVVHKTDVMQMMQRGAPMIGSGLAMSLGPAGIVGAPVIASLGTFAIGKLAMSGRMQDVVDTFGKGCQQFEFELTRETVGQYFMGSAIGTYAPHIITFFETFAGDIIEALFVSVGL